MKDKDEVSTIFTACARRRPVLEKEGPRFSFDTTCGMHRRLSMTKGDIRNQGARLDAQEKADMVFAGRSQLRWNELIEAIKTTLNVAEKTAQAWVSKMREAGVIQKNIIGRWEKVT